MSSKDIHDILDFFQMKKSTNARVLTDKLYNIKNQRSSVVPKKSQFNFDLNNVKFKNSLPLLSEGPEGQRGENEISGLASK